MDLEYFNNFVFQASRPQTLQRDEIVNDMYQKYKDFGLKFITTPLEGTQRAWWVNGDFEKKLNQYLLDKILSEKGFSDFIEEYDEFKRNFVEQEKQYYQKNLSKEEFKNLFVELHEGFVKFADHIWMAYPIERVLDKEFATALKEKYPENFEEIYGAISDPTKLVDYQKMRLDICNAVIKGENFDEAAGKLTEKYSWYSEYSFIENLLDEKHFKNELEHLKAEEAEAEHQKLSHIETENKKAFDQAVAKIDDPKLNLEARIINAYVFIRTDRIDVFKKLVAPFRNIFDQISEYLSKDSGLNWTTKETVQLLNSEILDYLSDGIIPDLEAVKERVKHYVFVSDKDGTHIISDENEVNEVINYLAKSNEKEKVIKGKIAYKGLARGRVATVFSKDDLSKVGEDSILVARTTMVDYTPAMERALAFVTAEGGITSHAAIVSRELKKPCIVGTGNCMDLLKDGDMVEVDANTGIVKIIK